MTYVISLLDEHNQIIAETQCYKINLTRAFIEAVNMWDRMPSYEECHISIRIKENLPLTGDTEIISY